MSDQERKLLISRNASICLNKNGPPMYLLKNNSVLTGDLEIRKMELGTASRYKAEKFIMLLGATGSGKTTMINSMINYIFGVQWTDDFRVRLIPEEARAADQTRSQTLVITSYTIHHQPGFKVPFTVTIIDTPGFGDTSGINRDKDITKMIDRFFRTCNCAPNQITAVGFIAQSSLPRLTNSQEYVFDSILSLFGKDIADNIIPLFTFGDGQHPQVLSSFKAARIPFKEYFQFNNAALFVSNSKRDRSYLFNQMCWEMCAESFSDFFHSIEAMPNRSLSLTKQLLSEREKLQREIEKINYSIEVGISNLNKLEQQLDMLKGHELDIAINRDFSKTIEVKRKILEPVPDGTFTTTCIICDITCHASCAFESDKDKARCCAISNGYCTVCPGRCAWNEHKNLPRRFVYVTEKIIQTSEKLKTQYQKATGEKMTTEKIVNGLIEDFEKTCEGIILKIMEAKRCISRIREIALKPNPLSAVQYVDLLIEGEKIEREQGYLQRIKQLEEVKKSTLIIDQLISEGFDPFNNHASTIKIVKERYGNSKMDKKQCYIM